MVKLGGFEFTKRPDILRSNHRRHSSEFFIAGSLPTEDYRRLIEVIRDTKILDLEHDLGRERVVVADRRFTDSALWGNRYELLLIEFKPIELSKRHIQTNAVVDLGEKMFSPRFKTVAKFSDRDDEIPRSEMLDYKIDLRVDLDEKYEVFKLKFMDQYPFEQSRKNFSRWTMNPDITLEIFLGYLEQGGPISVAKGKVERISNGISASGTWVKLEGKGELRQHQQEYAYFVKDSNFFEGRLERAEEGGLRACVTAPLLPDLRPKDFVDFFSRELGTDMQYARADTVTHSFKSGTGTSTNFTFAPRAHR